MGFLLVVVCNCGGCCYCCCFYEGEAFGVKGLAGGVDDRDCKLAELD